ncbi:MAG TPA: type I-E CRISPR-associated protein Cse2/CasB [Acidobacteriota bacterium]|nr:type I-E CRISPR-associated protein Cse2/CasB [Acidobacteriota bacterium]
MERTGDFMELYRAWEGLKPGPKAELRRVTTPDELLEVPAFYRLFSGRGSREWEKQAYQRLIFCLPCIKGHTDQPVTLGAALARIRDGGRPAVSEKRLFQVVRSIAPNDMIQLRRILKMADPTVNWPKAAETLWFWNERSKRDMLEQYFLNQSSN